MIILLLFFATLSNPFIDASIIPVRAVWSWPSTAPSNVLWAGDGNISTTWVSWPCTAGGWRTNSVFNSLYGYCASGACSATCDASIVKATDGNPYTAGFVPFSHGEDRSWAVFPFPSGPQTLVSIYYRGIWPTNTTLFGITSSGKYVVLANIDPTQSYLDMTINPPNYPLTALRFEAISDDGVMRGYCYANVGDCKSMTITDVAVQTQNCFEQLTYDLGLSKILQKIKIDFSGVTDGMIATSLDSYNYQNITSLLKYTQLSGFRFIPMGNVTARYIRIRYVIFLFSKYNISHLNCYFLFSVILLHPLCLKTRTLFSYLLP